MHHTQLPITVLMAVYNGEKYLSAAINSILNQTYSNFELLIINDGSTDGTNKIIASFEDRRIRCITNKCNLNLCQSLAKGVLLSRGEFIARMDADDLAYPDRLEKQLAVMQSCPEMDLLGSNIRLINPLNKVIGSANVVVDPLELKWNIFFRNCFNHPTVMIRKSALNRTGLNYGVIPEKIATHLPEKLIGVGDEDYLLFGLLSIYGKVGNLNEVLLDYRIHEKSLTALYAKKQGEQSKRIASALRSIYIQDNITNKDIGCLSNSKNIKNQITINLQEINMLAEILSGKFMASYEKLRIKALCELQCVISEQYEHGFFRRLFVGFSTIKNIRSNLKRSDISAVCKYIFGARLAHIYNRYMRLLG